MTRIKSRGNRESLGCDGPCGSTGTSPKPPAETAKPRILHTRRAIPILQGIFPSGLPAIATAAVLGILINAIFLIFTPPAEMEL